MAVASLAHWQQTGWGVDKWGLVVMIMWAYVGRKDSYYLHPPKPRLCENFPAADRRRNGNHRGKPGREKFPFWKFARKFRAVARDLHYIRGLSLDTVGVPSRRQVIRFVFIHPAEKSRVC